MSLACKIDKYRTLKRIAAENRHLRARLVQNCFASRFIPQEVHKVGDGPAPFMAFDSTVLRTRAVGAAQPRFETSIWFPVHERCRLLSAVITSESKAASELSALTEALCIIPSSVEWNRIMRVFDSQLFVSFAELLCCLNGAATIHITRKSPSCWTNIGFNVESDASEKRQEFRATVSIELASIDEGEVDLVLRSGAFPSSSKAKTDFRFGDPGAKHGHLQEPLMRYDFGISGEWTSSVRDAIKLAVAKSFDALESRTVEEWRGVGKEAALVLNEIRHGGGGTSEMDSEYLDKVLRSNDLFCETSGATCREAENLPMRWTVRMQQQQTNKRGAAFTQRPVSFPSLTLQQSTSECALWRAVEIVGTAVSAHASDSEATSRAVEYAAFSLPLSLATVQKRRSFSVAGKEAPQNREQKPWLRWCLPGALLMFVAVQKRALHRCATCGGAAQLYDLSQMSESTSCWKGVAFGRRTSEFSLGFLPLFAVLENRSPLTASRCSAQNEDRDASVDFSAAPPSSAVSPQNTWHCPDVVVMLAMVRSALRLPHNSFPDVKFEQQAVHDPARRVRELTMGLYGDVDVLTRVRIEWATPRGTFIASAESDPARHSASHAERRDRSQWLSCRDTGYQRGPLPLLVAAVCSLFDQVMGAHPSASQNYPFIPVDRPFSRSGLDFLFYSWFGATPQVRCFSIGTVAPQAASQANAALHGQGVPDGFTSSQVGTTMVRAMLFYDVLGQRVLFAETHANDVADAVVRLDELAVEVNQIRHDACVPVSAARGRPFRSVARLQRWQESRDAVARAMTFHAAAPTQANAPPAQLEASVDLALAAPRFRRLLRRCIDACGSELGALWTVVELLARSLAAAPPLRVTATPGCGVAGATAEAFQGTCDTLSVHCTPDSFCVGDATAASGTLNEEDEEELELWLGRRQVPWNRRPLGKETTPPPASVVELRVKMRPATSHGGPDARQTAAAAECASCVVFRCRVDPLNSSNSDGSGGQIPVGVLPAVTKLCREALQYVCVACREHGVCGADQQLPAVEELLRWCAAADPVLARETEGFPPYEARFYAAPNLLGELLQGVAGKYSCTYTVAGRRKFRGADAIRSALTDADDGLPSPPVPLSSAQPSTIFYRSDALLVDVQGAKGVDDNDGSNDQDAPWAAASSRDAATQAAPPAVECVLFIDGFLGSSCTTTMCSSSSGGGGAGDHSARPLPPLTSRVGAVAEEHDNDVAGAVSTRVGCVLGRGVGRTKREAWRSAAWQALRLQFPHLLAQLEVLRDVTELMQSPGRLNLLCGASAEVPRMAPAKGRETAEAHNAAAHVSGPVSRLAWRWKTEGPSRLRFGHRDSAAPGRGVACSVDLVFADDSRRRLPGATATAVSAGEAYVLAGQKLLHLVREAQRTRHAHVSSSPPSPLSPSSSHFPWASAGCAAATSPAQPTAEPSRPASYYAEWRTTTHYTKSIWHAYAGALSTYFGEDIIVELRCDLLGEERDEGRRHRSPSAPGRVVDALSAVQVCARNAASEEVGNEPGHLSSTKGASTVAAPFAARGVAREVARAGSGDLALVLSFRQTPDSLLAAHHAHLRGTPALALLRATSWWLADLVEQCAAPPQIRAELRGLLRSRMHDLRSIPHTTRWSLAERVEAIVRRWTGCHVKVRLRRQASVHLHEPAWVAEVLVQIRVTQAREYSRQKAPEGRATHGGGFALNVKALTEEPGMWLACQAHGPTSDEAMWRLYCDVCEAARDAVHDSV